MLLSRHIDSDRRAPELYGNYWFNSRPLTLRAMQGDVVLLFFWDHASAASLRVLRHINRMHEEYGPMGLRIIGVQVADYAVVRDPAKKESIIASYNIRFPIVADDERRIADSYRVDTMPTACLIAPNGDIYDMQVPKGSASRVERSVQYLLRQAGYFGELPFVEYRDDQYRDYSPGVVTPDFDLGYLRGSLGNSEGYSPELPAEYHDPGYHIEGKFYAEGIWTAGRRSFEYAGTDNGYILFPYTGYDLAIVSGNERQTDTVRVLMDERPVDAAIRGSDIFVDDNGNTMVKTNILRSVHLISSEAAASHIIKLLPSRQGTAFYGVSFIPFDPEWSPRRAHFSAN
ncbi:MAG: redoxin domain-containing protein [Acidobacteriota bacterium]